jgi:hypothetical protein
MIQKNLEETSKVDEPLYNETMQHADSISTDLDIENQLDTEREYRVREEKKLKVYKRREKVIPKVVRRSVRLCKKHKNST